MIPALYPRAVLMIAAFLAVAYDLRRRIVPNWLTLPLLAAGGLLCIAQAWRGELPARSLWVIALTAGVLLGSWYWHLLRGGDLKLFLAGALFFPDTTFIVCLVAGLLAVAMAWFVAQEGRAGLRRLWALAQTVAVSGQIPPREEVRAAQARGGMPLAAGLLVGLMAYLFA